MEVDMEWFANQRTAVKLTLSFSIILLLILAVIWISYSTISFLENSNKISKDVFELRVKLNNLTHNEDEIRMELLRALLSTDPVEQQKFLEYVKVKTEYNDSIMKDINEYEAEENSVSLILNKMKSEYENNKKNRIEVSIPLIKEGKIEEAKKNEFVIHKDSFDELRNLALNFTNTLRDKSSKAISLSEKEVKYAKVLFLCISIAAAIIMIFLIISLNRLISNPLNDISKAARQMVLGDLNTINITTSNRNDEVGILVQTFTQMSQWIQNVANTANKIANGDLSAKIKLQSANDVLGISFQLMIKNLQKLTSEISETINLLSSSATEISAASSQLAASATEAATSVNETTTTIEEVRQTSHVANQKAQQVSKTAEKTVKISETGKRAANEINITIDEIQKQMNLIAESMVRLSEQTQAIGVIITTVDDLSQQSNLLSVNASIEAAKAGEQGKGFAVVAQEVKSLANQSKQATNQVRSILNDIQKATSASVMATEQGSKAVEEGVKKSEQAGESILMLVNSLSDASNAASQIAVSSQQQLIGMDQATLAMENIKQTSSQNVESSKQLEASVTSIMDMGTRLKSLVGQFKLSNSADL